MRLLLDEMLSPDIASELRDRGYDVESISGSGHEGLSDPEVLDLARSQQRALVTNNVSDFRRLHHAAVSPGGPGHCGLILMAGSYRRRRADVARVVSALEEKLAAYPGLMDLADGEAWLGG